MTQNRMALDLELADIRAEIARLKQRESALASLQDRFPVVPVFRRGWPVQRSAPASGDRSPAGA